VVDALLFPYLNDAARMAGEGYASPTDIDTAMKLGCALPRGPFEVLDGVGAAPALAAQQRLFAARPEPGLAPAPLLVQAAALGVSPARCGAR
ncbi:MAG: 3-hydroxyacyl-CoA dehydrogenase family protein, partial [Trebonia sp.]